MPTPLLRGVVAMATYMLLDAMWLGFLMNGFYRGRMATIGRMAADRFAPNWPGAIVVYVLLGAGIALFVAPRASGVTSAATCGALFGLVVYGVYDFTNYSMLHVWPLDLALVDTAWGLVVSGAAAVTTRVLIG